MSELKRRSVIGAPHGCFRFPIMFFCFETRAF